MSGRRPAPPSSAEHTLRFPELEREIAAHADETIFQSARRNGLRIVGACGGRGTCGTCVVRVIEGRIDHVHSGPPDLLNTDPIENTDKTPGPGRKKWLRACQLRVRSDCTVEVAPRSLAPVVRAEVDTDGIEEILPLDPAIITRDSTMPPASLQDNLSDADRMARAMGSEAGSAGLTLDLAAAQRLSTALRDGNWSLRTTRRGNELIDFAPTGSRSLGLAVDLGTTNIAAFLVDLENGRRVASLGIENPQSAWGADLISRINHAVRDSQAAQELRDAVVAAVNSLAHDLCQAIGVHPQRIVDAAICGNTAMQHLLLGLPVRQLGRAPFVAALRAGMDLKARDLGLAFCPGAWVHLAPGVGGFVGGDHVTALLATQDRWRDCRTSLVMDIGTNTEISLIHDGRILSASCPSGPALEGGHISCGMRAADGAIERVTIENGRIAVQTIGGLDPVGLCGSGVLDALSALRRAGIVNARGRLNDGHPDVIERDGKRAAVLAPEVYFTQDDVRAVQLAKAAIRTGVDLLLRDRGLQERNIERFIIAGAFGAYIDIASGIDIGLFPDLPAARFEQVGNAAGLGVRRMLTSLKARVKAAELAASCHYVELSTRGEFQKTFLQHIGFPADITRRPV
ncbi:MAG: ASKHA domain-containing protein [Proteobacteria bacterium]|nr:ASKHA domain-containing protein [Pseudomonadota bacterium]